MPNSPKYSEQEKLLLRYQNEPWEFFKVAWPDIIVWDKLREVLQKLVDGKRVAVPAGHGVGKTWLEARIALWFLNCFPPAKVITTAPTWPQVELLLWSEIKAAYNRSAIPLAGRILSTELKVREDWFGVGFSTSGKSDEREYGTPKFQGFHGENLLVIFDEAPGVRHEIWISAISLLVGSNNKILAAGNPTSPSGDFYEACKSPLWEKVRISSFDHPNVKEGRVIIPGAVTAEWIEDRRKEWGEDSPLWQAKVVGDFPDEGEDTLIPLSWAEACVGLNLGTDGLKCLGADIARYGGDNTVLAEFWGPTLQPLEAVNKKDTNWTIGRIKNKHTGMAIRDAKGDIVGYGYDAIGVDDTGVGGGVTDGLEAEGIDVEPFNFGASPTEPERFENLKAEIYWNFREDVRDKQVSLPNDPELINQLCSIKYKYTRKGKIAIESKDDMRKRGLKSPDKADAVVIARAAGRQGKEPVISVITVEEDDE